MNAHNPTPRRFYIAAFGDPGHAFVAIALGRALARRGHDVRLQTWRGWREHVLAEGMSFDAAPEYPVFFTPQRPLAPYETATVAATETRPQLAAFEPDCVVCDVLTVGAALAAECEGLRWATLVPHVLPQTEPGFPPYATGAQIPRTKAGELFWRGLLPLARAGLRRGRRELNAVRSSLGLRRTDSLYPAMSRELILVATFPQLEYQRRSWDPAVRVCGPLLWQQPYDGEAPQVPGTGPLVLVAPSTSQDPDQRLLANALRGLSRERVRVVATTNGRPIGPSIKVPANARVVRWLSHAEAMRACDVVLCHAGHGTLVRALVAGKPVLACPEAGDMAENAARLAWARAGVALPRRLCTPAGIRLALRKLLADPGYARAASDLAAWASRTDPGERAAAQLERVVASGPHGPGETPRVGLEPTT